MGLKEIQETKKFKKQRIISQVNKEAIKKCSSRFKVEYKQE
jgi:hypothetical protein